jgi:hypothetical protein
MVSTTLDDDEGKIRYQRMKSTRYSSGKHMGRGVDSYVAKLQFVFW